MTLHQAVYCVPADALDPLLVPCKWHSAAVGQRCWPEHNGNCYMRHIEARRVVVAERVRQVMGNK